MKKFSLLLMLVALCLTLPAHAQDSNPAAWLRAHALPLTTTAPDSTNTDLLPLEPLIGSARIVGLGEATHGTHEFFTMKHRLVEFLVQEMGFTIVALEANGPEVERLNLYVHTGEGDPAALLGSLYWIWNTQEMLDLIEWLRAYNIDHTPQVSFVGFDAQYPGLASAQVLAYLPTVDPAAAASATTAYTCLTTYQLDTETGLLAYHQLPASETQRCGDSVSTVYESLLQNENAYTNASSPAAYQIAVRAALTVVQAEASAALRVDSGPHPRDRFMAENITWPLDQAGPAARMILWAHNDHLARTGSLGGWLDQAYGAAYVPFALVFYGGTFSAKPIDLTAPTVDPTVPVAVFEAIAPPESTYEYAFHSAGLPQFALDLRDIDFGDRDARWLGSTMYLRSLGWGYDPANPYMGFSKISLATAFDVVIFIDQSSPVLPN